MEKTINEEVRRQRENKVYISFYKMLDDEMYYRKERKEFEMLENYKDILENSYVLDGSAELMKYFDKKVKEIDKVIGYYNNLAGAYDRVNLMKNRILESQRQLAYAIAIEMLVDCIQDAYK